MYSKINIYSMKKLVLYFSILLLSCSPISTKSTKKSNKKNGLTEKKESGINNRSSSSSSFHYAKPYKKPYSKPRLIGAEGWIYPSDRWAECGTDTSLLKKIIITADVGLRHKGYGEYYGSLYFKYVDSVYGKDVGVIDYDCFTPDYNVGVWQRVK